MVFLQPTQDDLRVRSVTLVSQPFVPRISREKMRQYLANPLLCSYLLSWAETVSMEGESCDLKQSRAWWGEPPGSGLRVQWPVCGMCAEDVGGQRELCLCAPAQQPCGCAEESPEQTVGYSFLHSASNELFLYPRPH